MLDIGLVLLSAPVIVPVVLIVALLVARDGHNPFYRQKRIGRNGKIFSMWKIRSMIPNAEEALQAYLAENPKAAAEWRATQKLKNDPRITRIGRFIRRTSIDELPQLWNVANGDMALVGPRPMMVDQAQYYTGSAYFRLRPGLTGLWQISDRNNCNFVDRVLFDEDYAKSVSFGTDTKVIFSTFGVVLGATGY